MRNKINKNIAIAAGGLLAVCALVASTPKPLYVGTFAGDGTSLSNVTTSGSSGSTNAHDVGANFVLTNTGSFTGNGAGLTNLASGTAYYTAYFGPGTNFVLNGGAGATNYFVIQPTNTFWLSLTNVADRQRYTIEFYGMTSVFTGYYSNILFGADITGWSLTTNQCFAGFSSLSNTQGRAISFIRGGGTGY